MLIFLHKTVAGLDVCLIVGALICKCLAMRKNYDNRYEYETKWFWIRFMLICVSMATFPVEISAWRSEESLEIFFIADVLKFLCAISFFGILICGRKEVFTLIIKKYSEYKTVMGNNLIGNNTSEEA